MTEPLSPSDEYRARARRLREIAARAETAVSIRDALVMAAEEYEKLARSVENGGYAA